MNATMTRTATDATSAVLNGDHPDRDEVRARTRCIDLLARAERETTAHVGCTCCDRPMNVTTAGDRLRCWADKPLCIRCCSCCPDLIAAEAWWTERENTPGWASLTPEQRTVAFLAARDCFLDALND